MVKFRPIGNRVLLKRLSEEEKTAGGLFLPNKSQKKSNQAVVVAVGRGTVLENGKINPVQVKVGEHVVAARAAGQDVELENEEYWLVRDHDILYVVDHPEDIQ